MEEDEYRKTYAGLNPQRCVFEKAILTRTVGCGQAKTFCLAERYGVACLSISSKQRCSNWLDMLKVRGRFALGVKSIQNPLPHALEMKIQMGGLQGLRKALGQDGEVSGFDIDVLLSASEQRYQRLSALPFGDIVQSVVRYEVRRRKK